MSVKPKSSPVVEVLIESAGWRDLPDVVALAGRAVATAAGACGKQLPPRAEVSLLLADDAALRALNGRWRGKDKPTNVLSFPAATPATLARSPVLGDIAIAWETLAAEAGEEGKTVGDHFCHLVVHGFLHLVGYDHETAEDAETMEALERTILAELGVSDPYADTALSEGGPSAVRKTAKA
jgi:probable rRNA maturation factor